MTVDESAPRSRWRRALDKLHLTRTGPGTEERLPWTVLALMLFALVLVVSSALWFTLDWLERVAAVKTDPNAAIGGKDFVIAKLDAVKIALSAVGGGIALFALYLAMRRQMTAERDLRVRVDAQAHTEDDARARRVTELYAKAADQLGSDKAPVRLAGLYALERLGQENPGQRATIASLWCAYLRMPYIPPASTPTPAAKLSAGVTRPLLHGTRRRIGISPPNPDSASPDPKAAHAEAVLERDVRLSVQRLLAKHLRPQPADDGEPHRDYWPEIPELDLTEATLIDIDLSSCRVPPLHMKRGSFIGAALFRDAVFASGARFNDATFADDVRFDKVTFTGAASFDGVTFNRAWFTGVTLTGSASFRDATFTNSAWFDGATLGISTEFRGATFAGLAWFGASSGPFRKSSPATFHGAAMFTNATFTNEVRFDGVTFTSLAYFDDVTFTDNVRFDGATFTSFATRFARTVFESAVSFKKVRVHLKDTRYEPNVWPQGWTLDAANTEIDGCVKWGQLVPVPEVLAESSRWTDWLKDA